MVAALSTWHQHHEPAAAALEGMTVLPAHVVVEIYSVLTRLPSGLAVAPALAAEVIAGRFPETALRLDAEQQASLVQTLARAGVAGGATYDGLIALEAKAHGEVLWTLDERAQDTYRRLDTPFRTIAT